MGKDTRETLFEILTFYVYNLILRISFGLSFCLGFANHICQTNKLQTAHTLHCTLDTVHYEPYRPELSTSETSKERGHI